MTKSSNKKIDIDDLDMIIFDFDGVMTDNHVYLDQDGMEFVKCSRSDGLAFDGLRKFDVLLYILSTEKSAIAQSRGKKIKVPVLNNIEDKAGALKNLAYKEQINLSRVLYVGNDINDYFPMTLCGYSVCPSDSHKRIIKIATFVLESKGGDGVVREIVEDLLNINLLDLLYNT